MTKKLIAELFATFTLALTVKISLSSGFPIPTPALAALTLGIFVYTIGPISGAHLNPAITVALLGVKKITPNEALLYIIAQFAGAMLAAAAAIGHFNISPPLSGGVPIMVAEALGAAILAFGVASVVFGKTPAPAAGLTIGSSLLVGISIAAGASNGVLNPAVAVGIGSGNLFYIVSPFVGALPAMRLYSYLQSE